MATKHQLACGLLLATAAGWGLVACSKAAEAPGPAPTGTVAPTPLPVPVPAGFPAPTYRFSSNPPTLEGFELGRTLFYDGALSRDGLISCAECHQQAFAFTHHAHPISHGSGDLLGNRNSLPLQNLAWQPAFMWDGGIQQLDLQALAPIGAHEELATTVPDILGRLRQQPRYGPLFKRAFGSDTLTSERFLKALSQFMVQLVSADAKYDRYRQGRATLTADETAGLQLFTQKCSSCHRGELFTDFSYRNNGVVNADPGRYGITLQEADRNKFRVPSLRNVERSMPYMHDGRFTTLEAVLRHYATGIADNPALDPLLRPGQMRLTDTEQKQIIAFLRTLTDYPFLSDNRFHP